MFLGDVILELNVLVQWFTLMRAFSSKEATVDAQADQ